MTEDNGDTALDVDALVRENERLKSNVQYLETHYRRLEAFISSAPLLIYIKNGESQYTAFSPVCEHRFGLDAEDIRWHTDLDLAGNCWGALSMEQDAKVLSGQVVATVETNPRTPNASPTCLVVRFPFVDPDGQRFIGAIGFDLSQYSEAMPSSDSARAERAFPKGDKGKGPRGMGH